MSFVEILKVIVLGIVEGFTEWLPISSTGHMILVDEIIHLDVSEAYREVFMVVIQLGAILAVMVLYFNKLNPFSPHKSMAQKRGTIRLWIKIIIACIPAAVIGLPLDHFMDIPAGGRAASEVGAPVCRVGIVVERGQGMRLQPAEDIRPNLLSEGVVYRFCGGRLQQAGEVPLREVTVRL